MTISIARTIQDEITSQIKVSHLEKKVDCAVVETAKANRDIREKLGKEVTDNSDMILGFVLKDSVQKKQEEPSEDAERGSTEAEGDSVEGEEQGKKEVNESVKVQDLTSQMLSVPVKSKGCGCACVGKRKKGKTAKPAAMPLDPIDREKGLGTPYTGKTADPEDGGAEGGEAGGDAGAVMAEAETEATGQDLVEKVRKCVQKVFKSQETDSNRIEIREVPGLTGVYYCPLKFGTSGIDSPSEK